MIKKLFEKYKEVISYVFFGVLATVVKSLMRYSAHISIS